VRRCGSNGRNDVSSHLADRKPALSSQEMLVTKRTDPEDGSSLYPEGLEIALGRAHDPRGHDEEAGKPGPDKKQHADSAGEADPEGRPKDVNR
jgi:hypothetical protein